jgi:tetratricopeptide (TPR) repeat protein
MRPLAFLLPALLAVLAVGPEDARPPGPPAAAPEVDALLRQADEAWARRDQPGALDELRARLQEAEGVAPEAYEVLWRLSRLEFWIADDPALSRDERSRAGRRGWEYGDRATRADPARVEGWHYAAAGVGNYALGIGVLRALSEGIEGKFKERLRRAEAIDPGYSGGAIQTAWGRFWSKLPWPKYDGRKAERALQDALARNPDNVRAHVYLAEVLAKAGDEERARAELTRALAAPPGRYDAPEERRMQAVAGAELDGLGR